MQKDLLTHIMRLHSRWPKWPFSRDFYSAVASVLALMGFCFCAIADVRHVIKYAPSPSYDSIPITPKTWEEVDLIYYSTIYGHRYTNTIQLLRPIAWLHTHHMDIIGSKVTLSMPEFGIVNVMATVKAIKPTQIDTCGVDWSKQKSAPVIGKFMRYVTDVRTYTFKDSLGHISHINATPNHPFYVKNKHGFVAIGNVSVDDALVGAIGSGDNHINRTVHLVCAKGKYSHCGTYVGSNVPPTVSVYNLEVYRRHVYRVGSNSLIVHNTCLAGATLDKAAEKTIDYVNSKIKYSATRESLNENGVLFMGEKPVWIRRYRKIILKMDLDIRDHVNELANAAKHFSCGDCMEMSALGAQFLKKNGFGGAVSVMGIGEDISNNHAFIRITSGNGDIMVVDPWDKAYYPYSELTSKMKIFKSETVNGVIRGTLMSVYEYNPYTIIDY